MHIDSARLRELRTARRWSQGAVGRAQRPQPAFEAMREGVLRGLDFTSTTVRPDFWWFLLAVVMVLAFAELLAEALGPLPVRLAQLAVLLPWIAACVRRLRDAGLNPWWVLISLAPVAGIVVLLYLLSFPTKAAVPEGETKAA